jgi:hypothetical protein
LGGKGSTELQDVLVGRRWEGSDVPTSILEAAELFSKRMRATRALKQMWEARVDFMKQERGWRYPGDSDLPENWETLDSQDQGHRPSANDKVLTEPSETQRSIERVDKFYQESLPHMQSVVIVLCKVILNVVTELVTRSGQNGLQAGIQFNDMNGHRTIENGFHHMGDSMENTIEEVDRLRSQEILTKAMTAFVFLLLKWFKISHILQYEYMTQLLTDANYIPLVIKMWQTCDIGRACHFKLDRDDCGFFRFCLKDSRCGLPEAAVAAATDGNTGGEEESEDEAAPPPIKLKRNDTNGLPLEANPDELTHPPEVDELGYPTTPMPSRPIRSYSYRNMFTMITYLRIMQKLTRRKTHRSLFLVQYKSSQFLRKSLKMPVYLMRYYTLKLYKSQVPFCGRKWRQSNMKVITAVWLSIPAGLRDDWLSGGGGGSGGGGIGDVDGTVEDAVPLEQSLRNLTHWWNVRNYPDVMGVDKEMLDEERNYFSRELEKMALAYPPSPESQPAEPQQLNMPDGPWEGPMEGY